MSRRTSLLALAVTLAPSLALAVPVFSGGQILEDGDPSRIYDLEFRLPESVTAVAGETRFLPAQIVNTGTEPIRFGEWVPDLTPSEGGWRLRPSEVGISSGVTITRLLSGFENADGIVLPIEPFAKDWSELSGAVIAPGETLDFVFKTFAFSEDASIAVGGRDPSWETGVGIGFGDGPFGPFGQLTGPGWRDTILPPIVMGLDDAFSLGPLRSAALETLGYGALGGIVVLVPEPSTALLLGVGLVWLGLRRPLR